MITRAEAEQIVLASLNAKIQEGEVRAVVTEVWLRPYGWVVFYDSEKFVQTGNFVDGFFGNGPQVVMHDKRLFVLGSGRAPQERRSSRRSSASGG